MVVVDYVAAAADDAARAGFCVVPPCEDGTKRPDGAWKQYQSIRPEPATVASWYHSGHARSGVGLICGKVSGGLEMFEFEGRAIDEGLGEAFDEAAIAIGLGELVARIQAGYCETTPTGGVHLLYRCETVGGNTKLARRLATLDELMDDPDDRIKVLIETRGEGGYTIVAPSAGHVHPSGRTWELRSGGFEMITTITPSERDALFDLARSFDQMPVPTATATRTARVTETGEDAPGADFGRRGDVPGLLRDHGWTELWQRGDDSYWRRPGKDSGQSAIWHADTRVFVNWSSSTMFEQERGYNPFAIYTVLTQGSDSPQAFSTAAAQLRRDGYGAQRERPAASHDGDPGPSLPPELEDPPDALPFVKVWTTAELLAANRSFEWSVRGLLASPTYGQIAGEKKTLKSYIGIFLDIAIASGEPLFGQFGIDKPGTVVNFVGEGGRIPYTNRLERIARAMEVDLAGIPLLSTFDVPKIGSPIMRSAMQGLLDDYQPALVHLDPLYAFHGTDTDAKNLFDSGAMLSSLSGPCMEADACLLINNHYNKTGTGRGLERITQSGSAEWCDTWILLTHRTDIPADVAKGQFYLTLEIGSRQWGGSEWELDLTVGRFDVEGGEFEGDISWAIRRSSGVTQTRDHKIEGRIIDALAERPWELTAFGLYELVKGNRERFDRSLDVLIRADSVAVEVIARAENGVTKRRKLLGLKTNSDQTVGQSWSELRED